MSAPQGVCSVRVSAPGGVCVGSREVVCAPGGVSAPGGVVWGGIPACTEADPPL